MRGDLEMPPGKLAAQAAHALSATLIEYLALYPERLREFHSASHSGSRIVLLAKNEQQIRRAHEEALAAGLPCAVFSDSGHILLPHFTGAPVLTGLGIGPAPREAMRSITRRFRCA